MVRQVNQVETMMKQSGVKGECRMGDTFGRGKKQRWRVWVVVVMLLAGVLGGAREGEAAAVLDSYYAHEVKHDEYGVIGAWHEGLNGQLDERLRIAVEVYKRYPWVDTDKAVMAAPDFIYNSHWSIKDDGTILIPPTNDWMCGDLSQRAWSIIKGLTDYYRYSGDPIAFLYIPLAADYILDYGLTGEDHEWPRFPISTPTRGKAYGKCDPTGRIQLDLCAIIGTEMLRAYKLTGNERYWHAAKHWGDVFAAKCNLNPGEAPWNRYVDPSMVGWSDVLTGSMTLILEFLDELVAMGYTGEAKAILEAREAGRNYLRDHLLGKWIENDVWGRNYWDWDNPVICGIVSMIGDYFLYHDEAFGNWPTDVRNMLTLIFNRNSADPGSMGEMYSGAWAFPESSTCCGTSLSYNQYTAAPTLLHYGWRAQDERIREIGRRMMLMATYDSARNGVVKDGLLGGQVATGEWSNLAHPWPLCQVMEALKWTADWFGPNRENHIMRSSSVVTDVKYGEGDIRYRTYDAGYKCIDVARLSFEPTEIRADGKVLARRANVMANGYTTAALGNGDVIVEIRHDGCKEVVIRGDDPQETMEDEELGLDGSWRRVEEGQASGGGMSIAESKGAEFAIGFLGNQVRLIGKAGPKGGLADVYVDGEKQLTLIDCWNPEERYQQVLYYKSGLENTEHTLRIVSRGEGNLISKGSEVVVDAVQFSSATGRAGYGQGGGPRQAQRMIFGYTSRQDYIDTKGRTWRPATEFVIRSGYGKDTVEESWWTERRSMYIGGTADEELYRYGVHGDAFTVNVTVNPQQTYDVVLHFAETPLHWFLARDENNDRITHTMDVVINGREVMAGVNIAEEAGGLFKAYERSFKGIRPVNGVIEIEFKGTDNQEAMIQALEVLPSKEDYVRVELPERRNMLSNGDFEADIDRVRGAFTYNHEEPSGWTFGGGKRTERGLQNVGPWGRELVGVWLGTSGSVRQAVEDETWKAGARYDLRVAYRGKGKEGAADSTAEGNALRIEVGCGGRDTGINEPMLLDEKVAIAADGQWLVWEGEFEAPAEAGSKRPMVQITHEHKEGTADAYVHLDEVFLGLGQL